MSAPSTPAEKASVRPAPTTLGGILRELGPGLIVAGAVVGSGELIATTAVGAEAGFWLLWLIIVGCVIKVFVQVELGRYVILTGNTTLRGVARLPGWKIRGIHWIVWFWLAMFITSTAQQGGIVGGVGQALSIAVPLTEKGAAYNESAEERIQAQLEQVVETGVAPVEAGIEPAPMLAPGPDPYIWAVVIALLTSAVLFWGRYGFIEKTVTILVAGFTLVTLVNLALLQSNPDWAVKPEEWAQGLSFRVPPPVEGLNPVATALATLGIIGVAAGELVFYPYWCLEKGYAAHIGPREDSDEWRERARGWLRVLRWDAWASMGVYTVSTVGFYLLGASVLGRAGLHPEGMDMIRTLASMYEPVFNETAVTLFLVAAVVILYSTFFVTNASKARVFADALVIFGLRKAGSENDRNWIRLLSLAFPIVSVVIFLLIPKPRELVLVAGMMQAFLLPMLAFAAIWFRYHNRDPALEPSLLWDIFLWISGLGLLVAGGWMALSKFGPLLGL